ncbi:MAG: glycosyltransferase [Candidatus Omnitrophota bacterium]
MKFLITHMYNPNYFGWLYSKYKGLAKKEYKKQLYYHTVIEPFFLADFYSLNLKKLGHQAYDVIANSKNLQKRWTKENVSLPRFLLMGKKNWFYEILKMQIKEIKPDVLINPAMAYIDPEFLKEMKSYVGMMVGQFPEPLPSKYYKPYDFYLSSLPNLVEKVKLMGKKSIYLKLGFQPSVNSRLKGNKKDINVSSVSGFGYCFKERIPLFERICQNFAIQVRGYGEKEIPKQSPLRECFQGPIWGMDMFQLLKDSKIVVNKHADSSHVGNYANNLRMYEATGVGTLLITDWKKNLANLFRPGKEVVVYKNEKECLELIDYYLKNDMEREMIAEAGKERTHSEHAYYNRMKELLDILEKWA